MVCALLSAGNRRTRNERINKNSLEQINETIEKTMCPFRCVGDW